MNHSNEGIWEPPLAGGKPRRLTHFTASRIFDFNWFFDHARLLLTRGNVNSDVVLLSNLTECIPFLTLQSVGHAPFWGIARALSPGVY